MHPTLNPYWARKDLRYMNWSFLISFGIGLAVYLVGLFVFAFIKRYRNKKSFDKEVSEHKDSLDHKSNKNNNEKK